MKSILQLSIIFIIFIACTTSNYSRPDYNITRHPIESLSVSIDKIEKFSDKKIIFYYINIKNVGSEPINSYSINLIFPVEPYSISIVRDLVVSMGPTIYPGEQITKKYVENEGLFSNNPNLEVTGVGMITQK